MANSDTRKARVAELGFEHILGTGVSESARFLGKCFGAAANRTCPELVVVVLVLETEAAVVVLVKAVTTTTGAMLTMMVIAVGLCGGYIVSVVVVVMVVPVVVGVGVGSLLLL